jgi:hypothetical protein
LFFGSLPVLQHCSLGLRLVSLLGWVFKEVMLDVMIWTVKYEIYALVIWNLRTLHVSCLLGLFIRCWIYQLLFRSSAIVWHNLAKSF